MQSKTIFSLSTLTATPDAYAIIQGGSSFPDLTGVINFYQTNWGMGLVIEAEFANLPNTTANAPRFLGFHLHENGTCNDNFTNTGMHYNPTEADHPYHLGDFPSILNSNGYAYLAFYDGYLSLPAILGRSVIVHSQRDDFSSQPSGDSGDKIACGIVQKANA
ncbi:MAG: superoxide dismutase family protein [Lachnospiraceae bacterium]|nr:superoxide dismutase family protein [Lachnospiraceae bacterium]